MANYKTVVTETGLNHLAAALAAGEKLSLTQARVGSGRPAGNPGSLTALVQEEPAQVSLLTPQAQPLQGKTVVEFSAEATNQGLKQPLPVREAGIFAQLGEETFLFVYIYLDGPDSDNVLPLSKAPEQADTKHLYTGKVVLASQEAAAISMEIILGSGITYQQMQDYAAPREHGHTAAQVRETTGETVEQAQRRQDQKSEELARRLAELSQTGGSVGEQLTAHLQNGFAHVQGAEAAQDNTFYGRQEGEFGFYPASSTEITTLPLQAAKWQAAPGSTGVFRQQVTQADIVAQTKAGRTALDAFADLDTEELLEYQGVEKLWLENQNGTPMAFAKGAKPAVDLAVQVRVIN